jgi:hypothetical protein
MKYCSLGEMCLSATLLKNNGLKDASYPFDWIFSSVEMVKHCIEDDFKTFLDKSYYQTSDDHSCNHLFYHNMIEHETVGKVTFNHHNPLIKEEDYAYFKRCIDRFKNLLASSEEKTFVLCEKLQPADFTNGLKEALEFVDFLEKHTSNYKLIVIYLHLKNEQSHQLINGKNLKFLVFNSKSELTGITFANEEDDIYLNKLFNEIR